MIRKKCTYLFCLSVLTIFILMFNLVQKSEIKSSKLDLDDDDLADTNSGYNYLNGHDDKHLLWFLQISDLHLSEFHDATRIKDFEYFCNQTLRIIKPKLVLATGDLTDAKEANVLGSRQFEFEWKTYSRILRENDVLSKVAWLDVRGNHDNFDVMHMNSPNNMFKKYAAKKDQDKSYIHEFKLENTNDKYTFIAVDATFTPGPKRPFNFFGRLTNEELEMLKYYSYLSQNSNGTIWFGHYPSASIHDSSQFRSVMTNGVAYLCGHLHTLGGLLEQMYSRNSNGMLELELADMRFNRKFRIMAFDGGLFSFRDVDLYTHHPYYHAKPKKTKIFTLITNPKSIQSKTLNRREPYTRIRQSTHIRVLVFAKHTIKSVQIYVDNVLLGNAKRIQNNSSLYTIEWIPLDYLSGVHALKVVAKDTMNNEDINEQEFSLSTSYVKSLGFFSSLILLNDQVKLNKTAFHLGICLLIGFLIFFRTTRKRFTVSFVSCGLIRHIILKYFRRFALICSINQVFYYLILSTLYLPLGPWFLGEFLEGHYGLCFAWGLYVNNQFIKVDFQYVLGVLHLAFFQSLVILDWSYLIEFSFRNLNEETQTSTASITYLFIVKNLFKHTKLSLKYLINLLWRDSLFILLIIWNLFQMYDIYASYALVSILVCPLKTYNLLFVIYLRYFKLFHLKQTDFNLTTSSNANNQKEEELVDTVEANTHYSTD